MKKGVLAGIITALALIAAVGIVVVNNSSHKASTSEMSNMTTQQTSSNATTTDPETVKSGEVNVAIQNFAFSQNNIKIKKGTKVTWTNQDSAPHTVTPDQESASFSGSSTLNQGASYSNTFNEVGTFAYHCSIHTNMTATITVVE